MCGHFNISHFLDTAWAEIDLAALRHNAGVVRQLAPNAKLMAMLKADAYGHGLMACAEALRDHADGVAVARLDAAEKLRQQYPGLPLLLTASCLNREALIWCQQHNVAIVLHEDSVWRELESMQDLPPIWLKLNSGMNRLGFSSERFTTLANALLRRGQRPVLMTHFACADEPDSSFTLQQMRRFDAAAGQLPGLPHSLANSAGIIAYAQSHRDWVRPGVMLYGVNPMQVTQALDLRPVMKLKARVLSVNAVAAGEGIGYGQHWVPNRPTRIATVGIGYGDGYPRTEQAHLQLAIHGQRADVVGRVSMDMLAVDVSAMSGVQVGDEVELWGDVVAVDELAHRINTISYDLLCRVQSRVRHVYLPGP